MNIEADGDILREYVNEAQEHLDNIEQGVLQLEENPEHAEVLNTVFRAFHTFKGGAGFLNLVPINQLAHTFESLLDLARKKTLKIDRNIGELILQGGDLLKRFVAEMRQQLTGSKPPAPFALPTQALIAGVKAVMAASASLPQTETPAPAPKAKVPEPEAVSGPPAITPPASSGAAGATAPPMAAPAPTRGEPAPVPSPGKPAAKPSAGHAPPLLPQAAHSAVKVDTLKLDTLVDLVGELVIAQSFVSQHPDVKGISNQFFTRSMAQLNRITKELQRTAMSMRMVPVGGSFQKMMRVVRDLATKQQKQVQLILSGEDTELDRTIVEEISDPLLHMIRNSVDHGIEKPEVRVSRGKPSQGVIRLRAFHRGGNVVIQIQDDGNGLDRDRILKKAIEKGLVSSNAELTDLEIFQLIFAAGFSTAEVVTDVSGRGVGMDVVKRNIEKLQGKVEIESVLGEGTTFTIYLPLTLAIIEALVVSVGDQRFIIPALSVRESFQVSPQMLSTVYNRGEMVKVRDRLIPLLRLYEHFDIKPRFANPTDGIGVVLEAGRATRCLLVDQLLHKQEVVIKSLGQTLKRNPFLAGAAILGDGRVGLILDVNALVELKPSSMSMAA
ncbi:MAG: chemotaxis protein CheA [Verrucomicrobia bacterium]|nr:chemotaxis protein CheA [Verrucomicrobiota bacterium]